MPRSISQIGPPTARQPGEWRGQSCSGCSPDRDLVGRSRVAAFRLYDLRHTTATLLLAAGVNPKVVSERLGHAAITLTLDTYSHVLPTMQADATAKFDAILCAVEHVR
jgi:integrase